MFKTKRERMIVGFMIFSLSCFLVGSLIHHLELNSILETLAITAVVFVTALLPQWIKRNKFSLKFWK